MSVTYTSRWRVRKHAGAHRSAELQGFDEPVHFGIHSEVAEFYAEKYGRRPDGPSYPATLDYIVGGVAG